MSPVAVVTDTTHYLPRELVDAAGAQQVSLYVNDSAGQHRESEMPDFDAFYARLRDSPEFPTTSHPSLGDSPAVYEPLAAAGNDIVSIHLGGEISGTVGAARQAAAELLSREGPHPRIEVVDSATVCAGLGVAI